MTNGIRFKYIHQFPEEDEVMCRLNQRNHWLVWFQIEYSVSYWKCRSQLVRSMKESLKVNSFPSYRNEICLSILAIPGYWWWSSCLIVEYWISRVWIDIGKSLPNDIVKNLFGMKCIQPFDITILNEIQRTTFILFAGDSN